MQEIERMLMQRSPFLNTTSQIHLQRTALFFKNMYYFQMTSYYFLAFKHTKEILIITLYYFQSFPQ